MKTRLGCFEFLPPAHETTARYGLVVFRTFLKSEFSDENIEFWMACEDYKKVKGSTKLASKASKIYNEFIDVKAPREINIDYRTRERTKRTLLMEKDSYPRFLRSKMYQDIVNRTHAQSQRRSV
uniref:Regulator of G-protein signaling 8 n=1 Tax=Neogobius melanostomus TaxID=47308 RepID=A0A8C6T9L0_9GOBI